MNKGVDDEFLAKNSGGASRVIDVTFVFRNYNIFKISKGGEKYILA